MVRPSLGARLNSFTVHTGRALRKGDGGDGLAWEHRSALSLIVFGGPSRMGTLAQREQVSAPAITRTVGILEKRGLVRRARDPKDQRATLIVATDRGRRAVFRGRDERGRRIDAALRAVSPAARRRIGSAIEDLEELVRALET